MGGIVGSPRSVLLVWCAFQVAMAYFFGVFVSPKTMTHACIPTLLIVTAFSICVHLLLAVKMEELFTSRQHIYQNYWHLSTKSDWSNWYSRGGNKLFTFASYTSISRVETIVCQDWSARAFQQLASTWSTTNIIQVDRSSTSTKVSIGIWNVTCNKW